MSKKQCLRCQEKKPLDQFHRCPDRFGGDGRTKNCKDCTVIIRAERKAARAGDAATESEPAEAVDPNQPKLSVAMSLGIDVTYNGTDFVIEQTGGEGKATIWLAPHELRRLIEFADDLAKQAEAAAVTGAAA